MESTASERIKSILEENNVSIRGLCDGNSAMSRKMQRQLNEGSTLTSDVVSLVITKFPRYRPLWILNGTGQRKFSAQDEDPAAIVHTQTESRPPDVTEGFAEHRVTDEIIIPNAPKDIFYVVAYGNSMVKKGDCSVSIPDGSYVALRKKHTDYIKWGEVYAISTQDGMTIKKLMPDENDDSVVVCVSYNSEEYPSFTIKKADIIQCAAVVGVVCVKWR